MSKINRHLKSNVKYKHDKYYDSTEWRTEREQFFKIPSNQFCYYCAKKTIPVVTIAFIKDHQLCRRLFPELAEAENNFKPACRSCDQKKRQIESRCFDRTTLLQRLGEGGFYP